MSTQQSQLEATFLNRLQPKASPPAPVAEQGELAGRRRDPSLFSLNLDRIRPDDDQVRHQNKNADDPEIQELAHSIRAVGILQPLDVRYIRDDDYYEIVAGERRYQAAKLAGLQEVPVKLVDADDREARRIQLLENIHRANLAPLELAAALQQMLEDGATPDDLARLLCKTNSFVTKILSVARNLSLEAKDAIQKTPERFQSIGQLYEVSQLPAEEQPPLIQRISQHGMTREELQVITAQVKERARARGPSRGGRPVSAKPFVKVITLKDASVIVRFRKTQATREEIADALRAALDSLTD